MTNENTTTPSTPPAMASIFANIESLRLSSGGGSTSVTEILTHVPVRKPGKGEFFRVNPNPAMTLDTVVYEDPDDRNQVYLVPPQMRDVLLGQTKDVLLLQATNRQNTVFLWPLTIPNDFQPVNPWQTSAREASEFAKQAWVNEDAGKAQALEVLKVTLGILYSGGNKDKILGLNVDADWADMVGLMKKYNGLAAEADPKSFYSNDFVK